MNHLNVVSRSVDTAGAFTRVNAVADGLWTVQNNNFLAPQRVRPLAVGILATTLTAARFNAASLRRVVLPQIQPITAGVVFPTDPNVADYRGDPLWIPGGQEIQVDAIEAGAAAEQITGGIVWEMSPEPMPGGQSFTLRSTGATTAVALTWTLATLTFDETLPPGRYAIVGAKCVGATLLFFRLVIPGYVWRAGGLGTTVVGNREWMPQRFGDLGVWGYFDNLSLPALEIFCTAADTAQTLFLDLIQVQDRSGGF